MTADRVGSGSTNKEPAGNRVKIVTFMSTLMKLARELGQARLTGDASRIEAAERAHDSYHALCLSADEFVMEVRNV